MGRYQQWLLCQETDQSLRAQLEKLEAELASLQERMSVLERSLPHRENRLVRLLMEVYVDGPQRQREAAAHPQAVAKGAAAPTSAGPAGLATEAASRGTAETVGRLTPRILPPLHFPPNLALHPAAHLPTAPRPPQPGAPEARRPLAPPSPLPLRSQPPVSRAEAPAVTPREPSAAAHPSAAAEAAAGEEGLSPHARTEGVDRSQIEIPEWLHHLTVPAGRDHHPTPIDQASVRTNRLVQRWLERWGRATAARQLPAPSEDPTNG